VHHVGRADEHDFGEIVFDVEVMVREGIVQLRIEDFHEGRRGIASEVGGHLVHFIQDEDGVDGPGFLHHLNDLAGEGADVRAPMSADFGFIPHAAERYAHELAARGASDGHCQRRFADSGRPDEAQD